MSEVQAEDNKAPFARYFPDLSWVLSRKVHGNPSRRGPDVIREDVLGSDNVRQAIEQYAQTHACTVAAAHKEAARMFHTMQCDIWPNNLRVLGWVVRKYWRQMYEGIFVNADGINLIHEAEKAGKAVVLLPTHKSHMDYLVCLCVCL